MNKLASSDVYQNVTVTTAKATETTTTDTAAATASSLVYQRLKTNGDSKAYAYENFDCINECSDDRHVSDIEDMDDMDIADGAGNCNFTSNLVEDGFIRMSSPVESVDDLIDLTDDTAPTTGDVQYKEVAVPNEMVQLSNELAAVFNNGNKTLNSNGTNFPNVGSSPVDFNDSDVEGGGDSVASDGEDNLQVLEDYHQTEEEEEGNVVNDSFADSLAEDNSKDFGHQDFDGIILLNQPDQSNKELQSLSDTEEFGSECDDHDLAVEHSVQRPASIMKSSSKFKELDGPDMDTQDSLMFSSDAPGGVASMAQSKEHFNVPVTNCSASSYSKRAQAQHSQHQSVSSAAGSSSGSSKPKVRFNLDINYEKEREWNRVNRIIGDANKSSIEWTQEVEV